MKNTSLCYIEQDGAYLMIHRVKKKNDENHDKWIGVGGKFEAGESPFDCARREIREECGVNPKNLRYRGIVTFVSDRWETEYMHLFHSDKFTGELASQCPEGDLEWVDIDKICSLPIWEGDKIFLDLLTKPVPFFSLKLIYRSDKLIDHILEY